MTRRAFFLALLGARFMPPPFTLAIAHLDRQMVVRDVIRLSPRTMRKDDRAEFARFFVAQFYGRSL